MEDDAILLRRYADEKSEAAFAELVRRRIGLVYSVALRQCGGDAHLAEDVTQKVFADLARKAPQLCRRPVLSGWLCRSAQFAASDVVRAERRRRAREAETSLMHETPSNPVAVPDWDKLRPVLDQLMNELGDDDRDALALRFFEEQSFADIGRSLRLTEDAARKRVTRALDRLHAQITRRGVTSAAAALAGVLAGQAGVAAPAGLAASVTGAALAGAAGGGGGLAAAVTFMTMSKLQVGIAGAIAVAVGAGYFVQAETNAGLRREIAAVQTQQQAVAALRAENQRLASAAAEVEMLRRDDAELKRLEQRVVEVKQANADNARVAAKRAEQDRRSSSEAQLQEMDQKAQLEVDRMNREGNALVLQYRDLSTRAKDASLTPEASAQAEAAAKAKLEEIQAKKTEITAFVDNTRRVLMQLAAEMGLPPRGGVVSANRSSDGAQMTLRTSEGTLKLENSPPPGTNPSANPPPSGIYYTPAPPR